MKAADWIDLVKQAKGWNSDYRVAKELDLGRNVISNYRARPMTMDDETAIKVAVAIGEKPEVVLIDQAQERTRSDQAREAFSRALQRLMRRPPKGPTLKGGGGAQVEAPAAAPGEAGRPGAVDITSTASNRRRPGGPRNLWCPQLARNIHCIKQIISAWLDRIAPIREPLLPLIGSPA